MSAWEVRFTPPKFLKPEVVSKAAEAAEGQAIAVVHTWYDSTDYDNKWGEWDHCGFRHNVIVFFKNECGAHFWASRDVIRDEDHVDVETVEVADRTIRVPLGDLIQNVALDETQVFTI